MTCRVNTSGGRGAGSNESSWQSKVAATTGTNTVTKKVKGHELFCLEIVGLELEGLGREAESGVFDSSIVCTLYSDSFTRRATDCWKSEQWECSYNRIDWNIKSIFTSENCIHLILSIISYYFITRLTT